MSLRSGFFEDAFVQACVCRFDWRLTITTLGLIEKPLDLRSLQIK